MSTGRRSERRTRRAAARRRARTAATAPLCARSRAASSARKLPTATPPRPSTADAVSRTEGGRRRSVERRRRRRGRARRRRTGSGWLALGDRRGACVALSTLGVGVGVAGAWRCVAGWRVRGRHAAVGPGSTVVGAGSESSFGRGSCATPRRNLQLDRRCGRRRRRRHARRAHSDQRAVQQQPKQGGLHHPSQL